MLLPSQHLSAALPSQEVILLFTKGGPDSQSEFAFWEVRIEGLGQEHLLRILPSGNVSVIIIEDILTHGYLISCLCPLLCQIGGSKFNYYPLNGHMSTLGLVLARHTSGVTSFNPQNCRQFRTLVPIYGHETEAQRSLGPLPWPHNY